MFRALKNTQTEIMQSLLKFADEITGDSGQKPHCQSQSQCQASNTTEEFAQIIRTMHLLHQRLEAQNNLLNEMFEMLIRLNKASTSGVNLRDRRAAVDLTSDVTIPSLQPISVPIDMIEPEATLPQATLPRTVVPEVTYAQVAVSKLQEPVDDEVEQSLGEIEQEEEVDVEVDQEEEVEVDQEEEVEVDQEEEVEVEQEEEVEAEQEEEGIEVEEWTYKGLLLFKDTNNTVYKNENGDVGEAIGTYDSVKKTLKKL